MFIETDDHDRPRTGQALPPKLALPTESSLVMRNLHSITSSRRSQERSRRLLALLSVVAVCAEQPFFVKLLGELTFHRAGDKDIDEHDENEATPSKKAKSKASPGKGKGRGKKQDLKSEEMIKDEELSEAEVEADVGADQTS